MIRSGLEAIQMHFRPSALFTKLNGPFNYIVLHCIIDFFMT